MPAQAACDIWAVVLACEPIGEAFGALSEAIAQPAGGRAPPGRFMAHTARSAIEAGVRCRQALTPVTVSELDPMAEEGESGDQD